MLVLTRMEGESILIDGKKIKVEILRIRCDQVRLGVKAPKGIKVSRERIYPIPQNLQ